MKKDSIKKFKEILEDNSISFTIDGKNIIINGGYVDLSSLTAMPENVQFNNGGYVYLSSLTAMPENVQFNNGGDVDLRSLTAIPENVQFNNGGDVYLRSLTAMPENVQFNNGGYVYLISQKIKIKTSYLKRFKIKVKKGYIILFKKVSKDFKTQEDTKNETLWQLNKLIKHSAWNPSQQECGEGKFHACAFPFWADTFRNVKGDKYIAIRVNIKDLYEWTENPSYPQKIAFSKGRVLYEVDRFGNKI